MIEDKIFRRTRANFDRLAEYGFEKIGDPASRKSTDGDSVANLRLVRDLLDGDFRAEIDVDPDGKLSGRVIDVMNDEEFAQLRNISYNGSFVNTVRAEYETLLRDVVDKCFDEVTFIADQSNRIAKLIKEQYDVSPDFPWADDEATGAYGVFRHQDNDKWFGLIMNITYGKLKKEPKKEPVDVMNLKINPEEAETLHSRDGIYPSYHMNHKLWISVTLDETLSDEDVMELVDESFRLTGAKKKAGRMDEEFIKKVLELADSVPAGKVISYGQLAELAGRPKNARMVGKIMSMADRYGAHPCHRVVNSSGRTVPGWEEQRPMLEAEGVIFKANGCVDMEAHRWKTE